MNVHLTYLKHQYPFDVLNPKIILFIGGVIASMIFLFTPFGLEAYQGNKLLVAIGFGLITCLCLLISNKVIKKHLLICNDSRWTISMEATYVSLVLLIISMSNLTYYVFLFDENDYFEAKDIIVLVEKLGVVTLYTISIGIIPISGVILYRYNKMLKKIQVNVDGPVEEKKKDQTEEKRLVFQSQNIRDKEISISLDEILFMEAIRNHVHIYFIENDNLVSKSIRNTLTNIAENLSEESMFRCHRSFMINLKRIKEVKGNSNGHKVMLHGYHSEIPVSRNFAIEFQKRLDQWNHYEPHRY